MRPKLAPNVDWIELSEGKFYAKSGEKLMLRTPMRGEVSILIEGPALSRISVDRDKLEEAVFKTVPSVCRLSERPVIVSRGRPWGRIIRGTGATIQSLVCLPSSEEEGI
jgi:hypothetical protein